MKTIKLKIEFEVEIEATDKIANQFQLAMDEDIKLTWLHCDTEEYGEAFDLILDKALDDNLELEVKVLEIEEYDKDQIPSGNKDMDMDHLDEKHNFLDNPKNL